MTLDSIELRAQNERRYTYPKTPRMNAHCERFNRTVQEACIDYHYDRLFLDGLTDLNLELLRFLNRYIDNL